MSSVIKSIIEEKKLGFNVIKTLYFNFKVFKFKEAVKLPVWLYGRISFEGIHRGCVRVGKVRAGSVKIGGGWWTELFGYSNRFKSYIRIKGRLEVGEGVIIQQGVLISVSKKAVLKIGNNVRFNERVTIHSKMRIDIGDNCRIGWNTQILDTGFHYMINKGKLTYRDAPVFLDHNVWVTNGVSIMKGTRLPAYTVVASNSLVNKDYFKMGEHCLIGGIPAKHISDGVERLLIRETEIDKLFKNPNDVLCWEEIRDKVSKDKQHIQ